MEIYNVDLRRMKGRAIRFKEIADCLGVHRTTIYKWFNQAEMDEFQKKEIRGAIETIREQKREVLKEKIKLG